jgi:phosphotriesterase-related protein
MQRRDFLKAGVAAAAFTCGAARLRGDDAAGRVMTVAGPVKPEELGTMLPHEHVLVDFIGADQVSRERYDADEVFEIALPHLKRVHELGCRTLAECTPAYLGRDPALLKRLADASGLRLLTNTGYYGAVGGKYLPAHARTESADRLAQRWLAEWRDGIDGTGIRPGFIKTGADGGPLPEVNRRVIQAAARTHKESGLTIAGHTGDGKAALEQLEVLAREGVSPAAWIWVHAQLETDAALHAEAARRGAWVEFDGIAPKSVERHVTLVKTMKDRGLLDRVLISHDAGWYNVGQPRGGTFRNYETLFTQFLPALEKAGFTAEEVRKLTVENPARAFTIGVRKA